MGDDVRERGCEQYSNDLAELALGVLTGRERAQVLAHVESCPRCADELEHLSRVADTVVQSAPEMEPPLGFEVRPCCLCWPAVPACSASCASGSVA